MNDKQTIPTPLDYWDSEFRTHYHKATKLKDLPPEVGVELAGVALVDAQLATAAAIRWHGLLLEETMSLVTAALVVIAKSGV